MYTSVPSTLDTSSKLTNLGLDHLVSIVKAYQFEYKAILQVQHSQLQRCMYSQKLNSKLKETNIDKKRVMGSCQLERVFEIFT